MSKDSGSFGQAGHLLTLVDQPQLSTEQIQILEGSGHFTDLLRAIKLGILSERETAQRSQRNRCSSRIANRASDMFSERNDREARQREEICL
ncbi:MAG: hypothetical protein A2750_00680 [Candidatus Yanofskybacteria bacterium RIFCSPHIGHO2_01_FULL_45_42]|uniref:Uncharacterized protein n=3 Tax=Candidatus Yanofskyibacteriota TaxID=1752733 RepID=A0A1F8F7U4_9BACT|nr:MAG: hypothetical protein A2750_00680 [Candidatus Yanofskybacteria bacterium RIFCSPHIGHO2_01_FULL_45_42]OGN16367.1 MAG: hypothetical protein A3C81_02810 [Candidatus Yanofskybacteria bacterium RIFCSPHIGHO2_02_FULL_46_19]OGN26832.1 MAG: hypothetical protein A3B17_00325 [Candidatus Yanofskybacteria bacterium RIFCSPLOWO2_01_FULL_45_72]OGN32382.1 MAG: hypothetical protein A3J01_00470 [Candidatus Yanofskybacteria bacterium RIFCSPLOWO2_02_FULL_45_18]